MSDFSFSATAQCDICGNYLSSSDEECEHEGETVKKYVFREIGGDRESLTGVKSTADRMWHRLYDKVGEDWHGYEYLGPKEDVELMLNAGYWDGVHGLPKLAMSLDAPNDVEE